MILIELFVHGLCFNGQPFVVGLHLLVALDAGLVFGELYFEFDDLLELFGGLRAGKEGAVHLIKMVMFRFDLM